LNEKSDFDQGHDEKKQKQAHMILLVASRHVDLAAYAPYIRGAFMKPNKSLSER
jgi:hypothetical protein